MNKNLLIIISILIAAAVAYFVVSARARNRYIHELASDYNSVSLEAMITKASSELDKNPEDIVSLLALATAYAQKGSIDFNEKTLGNKAIEYADRVLALDPSNSEAYRIKGYAMEIQELYQQASEYYLKAIELNPLNFQAFSNLGHAYDLQGDLTRAEDYYSKSLQINPSGEHALLNLSRLQFRHGNFDDCKKTLEKLINTSQNKRSRAEGEQIMAELHIALGDFQLAREAISRSVENNPLVPQSWVTLGRIELRSALELESDQEIKILIGKVEEYANKALSLNKNQATAYLLMSDLMLVAEDQSRLEMYKGLALKAIENDITLGRQEREALKDFILSDVEIVDQGSEP